MYYLEFPINATVRDILEFLKSENEIIHPETHLADKPDQQNIVINFHTKTQSNALSIYTKIYTTPAGKTGPKDWLDKPDEDGNEIIRFEVKRVTDTRSVVKAFRDSSVELMFWKRLTRLAMVFDASFVTEAQQILAEVEKTEAEEKQTLSDNCARILETEDVFVSYSRKDSEYVHRLVQAFEDHSISVWFDKKIKAGEFWQKSLEEKIEKCSAFVVIMTPNSGESLWVQNEITYAIDVKKEIFPLLLKESRFLSVSSIQKTNVTDNSIPSDDFFSTIRETIDKNRKS